LPRLRLRRARPDNFAARVDRRTKNLLGRLHPGEVAIIDHEDLDRVSAEGLVSRGAAAVVNASRSISGRYPNLGPLILMEAGIPLIDGVGPLVLDKVHEGDSLRIEEDRIYAQDRLVAVGVRQSPERVLGSMEEARTGLADQFERFAENTLDFINRERDLLFGGAGLPDLEHSLAGRHVLVVVRGYNYREDLATLRAYIRVEKPVLLGVDGGADALIEAGYRPDVILGDMDSVSERALRSSAEIVLHAYPGGYAPGQERLLALGIPHVVAEATGTSEDVAFLLAHEKGAELIVAVGSHGNLREFLDKGREGMASTFLVRLRVGEILVDAKGVSRMYRERVRARDLVMLVGSAAVAIVVVALASQPFRLFAGQILDQLREFLRDLGQLF
jgi:uncharacterized membrane-anchored protein